MGLKQSDGWVTAALSSSPAKRPRNDFGREDANSPAAVDLCGDTQTRLNSLRWMFPSRRLRTEAVIGTKALQLARSGQVSGDYAMYGALG